MTQIEPPKDSPRRRRRRYLLLGIFLASGVLSAIALRNPWFNGNFGIVDPGHVFRAAQPGANLGQIVDTQRVASILNLRGGSDTDPYYVNEVKVVREKHLDFYDFPISATRRPTRRELLVLLDLFEHCRYPLLIHCKSGSDRTGLASALYLMERNGTSPDRAVERAFSLYYGHIPMFGTSHLHEPFREYAAWLKAHKLEHAPERLRAWVAQGYRDDDNPSSAFRRLPAGPRAEIRATTLMR